jgi:hypothetical protein
VHVADFFDVQDLQASCKTERKRGAEFFATSSEKETTFKILLCGTILVLNGASRQTGMDTFPFLGGLQPRSIGIRHLSH